MRIALSTLAGFLLWSVLWCALNAALPAVFPGAFDANGATSAVSILLGCVFCSVGFSILSGALTATLAKARRGLAVALLAGSLLAVGIAVEVAFWETLPVWFHLSFLALLAPATWLGGRLAPTSSSAPAVLSAVSGA